MLRVTIELLPGGFESKARVLSVGYIHNDLSHPERPRLGNYGVQLMKSGSKKAVWKRGTVKDFPRKVMGPWDLLRRALNNALEGRD